MRRPGIRPRQSVALQQGAQQHDQARAYQGGCDGSDEGQDSAVRIQGGHEGMADGSESMDASGVSDRGLIGKLMRSKSAAVNIQRPTAQGWPRRFLSD